MCWELFLGSDKELPQVQWSQETPAFNTQLLEESEKRVTKQFSLPNVIYVGSHQGCSCGFIGYEGEEPEEQHNREKDINSLSQYLKEALSAGCRLEIFLCWQGGELNTPVKRKVLKPDDFQAFEFPLKEDEFATVMEAERAC